MLQGGEARALAPQEAVAGDGVCVGVCFRFIMLVCVPEGLLAVYPVSFCAGGFVGGFSFL